MLSIKDGGANKSIGAKKEHIFRPQNPLSLSIFHRSSMASFPQFYSELLYPNTFSDMQSLMVSGNEELGGLKNNIIELGREQTLNPSSFDMSTMDQTVSSDYSDPFSSLLAMPYSDQYGLISDMSVPTLHENNAGFYGYQSLIGAKQPAASTCELREELFGFVPDFKPLYRESRDSWGTQSNEMQGVEETNIKVASRYSEEERKERIVRYLKKRNQRNFNKTIKYACRKTLADRRTRVRGRFARNNEQCDPEMAVKSNDNNLKQRDLCHHCDANFPNKEEEEERWVQELTASLMYMPYVTNYSGSVGI